MSDAIIEIVERIELNAQIFGSAEEGTVAYTNAKRRSKTMWAELRTELSIGETGETE